MVAAGDTVQVEPVVPAQLPPCQAYDVAAGLQVGLRVAEPPGVIVLGLALRVHTGGVLTTEKLADTVRALDMLTLQVEAVPLQEPPQPRNVPPVLGVAVSVTAVPGT